MSDLPIPFSGPMVQALLAGRKTQTRRATPVQDGILVDGTGGWLYPGRLRYAVGDRLYVREHWRTEAHFNGLAPRDLKPLQCWLHYEADGPAKPAWGRFRQGMHMPRWASRITLLVSGVRVERLQDISEADAKAEGPDLDRGDGRLNPTYKVAFENLWNSINGPGAWGANPWVSVTTFSVVLGNIDGGEK